MTDCGDMRSVLVLMFMWTAGGNVPGWEGDAFGSWKVARSTDRHLAQEILTVRFDPHPHGEVFTLDRVDGGRTITSSTILYFDRTAREFQGFGCSGTQLSARLDYQTVEILRTCGKDRWTRFLRRTTTRPNELLLEITEQQAHGGSIERRLVLQKR